MRLFLQHLLRELVLRLADKFGSKPDKQRVNKSLSALYRKLLQPKSKKGLTISFSKADSFIIFSDQHKGAKNGSDMFQLAEKNYISALDYYNKLGCYFINLGDCEELWANGIDEVKKADHASFKTEKQFLERKSYLKIYGNHDLYWDNDPLAGMTLKEIYGQHIPIYEGCILQTKIGKRALRIFMTHGHQGDLQSDGNWFSKWFISNIWAPLDNYLRINVNTPANNDQLKTLHNSMMADWSARHTDTLLITGHTHQPVFQSLTHLERLYFQLFEARKRSDEQQTAEIEQQIVLRIAKGDAEPDLSKTKPYYFNTGCCCFDDGDITGIEIADHQISLVRWKYDAENISRRSVLETCALDLLIG